MAKKNLKGAYECGTYTLVPDVANPGQSIKTDVPLGRLTEKGIQVSVKVSTVKIKNVDSDVSSDELPVESDIEITGTLNAGDFPTIARALGLPASALVSGLGLATPTADVLTVLVNQLGTAPAIGFYIKAPGAGVGTRRCDFTKAKLWMTGNIDFSREDIIKIAFKATVLAPDSGELFVWTDAAA